MEDDFKGNERFSILRRLGAGGMGVVYEAYDSERQTRVALKVLRNIDAASIYRFKIEFRALAELSHENLLPLYELFSEDNHWFFTMELLDAPTDLVTFIRGERKRPLVSLPDASREYPANSLGSSSSRPSPSLTSSMSSFETSAFTSAGTSQAIPVVVNDVDLRATSVLTVESVSEATFQGGYELASSGAISTPALPIKPEPAMEAELSLDYPRLRTVFLAVAQGVKALHAAGKLHRDLKPENVMVRVDHRPVLLDFGLILDLKPDLKLQTAEVVMRPTSTGASDRQISGTFAYMAPEQATGAALEDSSDWYAFGVMLFEALTGRLPFTGKSMDILRAKVSQDAPSPSRFAPSVPRDLDQLCIRLLSRDAAQRPHSAEIFRCLSQESPVQKEEEDPLAQNLFVGREIYLTDLDSAFAGLGLGNAQVLCVHGRSGVGKTALIQHFLQQTVVLSGGVLLEGRCYEQESVPYKAVDTLVDALTEFLIGLPDDQLSALLPENIQSLARIFPVLKRVKAIGSGGDSSSLSTNPLQVRQQAFEAFGQLLANLGARQTLVLYIDDLQWGDLDSAQLLASVLAQQPSPRILLLLSYRSEYSDSPCLTEFRRAWESGRLPSRPMEVLPLSMEESRKLAASLLAGVPGAEAQIDRIVEQARGSAFFVQELAQNVRSGMEWHSSATQADSAAAQLGALDEVLWRRVQRLPEEARRLIEMVAIAGQPILLGDLLHTRSLANIPQHSVKLLRSARLVRSTGARLSDEIETFHDRVRESIAKFLPSADSRDYHQQLADALEQNAASAPETIAVHLQAVDSPRASHFYELAGERAIQVLAFDRAEDYLKSSARLASNPTDRVRVEIRLIHFYTDTARFQDAYNIGVDAAARFGFKLPRTFVPPWLLANMVLGLMRKGRRKPSQLLDLPVMTDQRRIAVVGLISAMAKAAYQIRPEICVHISIMAVNLCLKYGNTPDSAVVYMVFGCIFLGGIVGRAETGYEFGRLALALIEKFNNEKQRAEVNFVVGYFGTSWMRPAEEAESLWRVAFQEGQRTGDLFHTGCAVSGIIQGMILRGLPLDHVEARIDEFWPVVERANLREPMTCLTSTRRLIASLRTSAASGVPDQEDSQLLADLAAFGSRHFAHFHFLNQCMRHTLMGNVSDGLKAAHSSAAYLSDSKGLLNTPEHHFWFAMLLAMSQASERSREKAVASAKKKFARWARNCPANFALRLELLSAEEARISRRFDLAMDHYQRAIDLGVQHQTLHLLGFANQRAYSLASSLGREAEALDFAQAARGAYSQWGATSLVAELPSASHPSTFPQGDRSCERLVLEPR